MTTVSPDLIRSTGSCALLNQPHCVVSSVAGSRCMVLPPGSGIARSFGSAGPDIGLRDRGRRRPSAFSRVGARAGDKRDGGCARQYESQECGTLHGHPQTESCPRAHAARGIDEPSFANDSTLPGHREGRHGHTDPRGIVGGNTGVTIRSREETPCPRSNYGPASTMAYEDHWFGAPWTTPETIVMIHGNSESSRAWTPMGAASRRQIPRACGPTCRASAPPRRRRTTASRRTSSPPTSDGFSMRLGSTRCHLIGAKYGGSACMQFASDQPHRLLVALPVRLADARQRHRQCRPDPPQGRAAMGGRDHAVAARQHGVRGADHDGGPTS